MLIFKQLVVICLVLSSVQGDSVSESRELQAFRLAIALTEGGGKVDYTQTNADGAVGAYGLDKILGLVFIKCRLS